MMPTARNRISLAGSIIRRNMGISRDRALSSSTFVCSVLCDLLGFCQQEPTLGQRKPHPSIMAIVRAVCLANAVSAYNATVVALGHRAIRPYYALGS